MTYQHQVKYDGRIFYQSNANFTDSPDELTRFIEALEAATILACMDEEDCDYHTALEMVQETMQETVRSLQH